MHCIPLLQHTIQVRSFTMQLPIAFTRAVQTRKRFSDKGVLNSLLIQLSNLLGNGLGLSLEFLKLANESRGVRLIVCF